MKIAQNSPLIIASHNQGKIVEIRELLQDFFNNIKSAAELDLDIPEETGATFEENALIKARATTRATGCMSIADDSGLVVSALNGEPGIYSARWAGESNNFEIAIQLIEEKLKIKNATDFSARFVCALAICFPNGDEKVVRGEISGTLVFPSRGTSGFGYDSIFIANGMTQTFGEITPEFKNAINHRARAFEKLKKIFGEGRVLI